MLRHKGDPPKRRIITSLKGKEGRKQVRALRLITGTTVRVPNVVVESEKHPQSGSGREASDRKKNDLDIGSPVSRPKFWGDS